MKGQYHTKQRQELLDYLEHNRGAHRTAAQIQAHFQQQGSSMGLATIYRQMDRLVQEGLARKYVLDMSGSACYEYVGADAARACLTHFHCKCESCGALIHLDCEELQAIRAHLLEHHGFTWDHTKTVFYGICEKCAAQKAQQESLQGGRS